jgi:hypothetical protein
MPPIAPATDTNIPIEMPMDTYQGQNVFPEPPILETMQAPPPPPPIINAPLPMQIPIQYIQIPPVVPKRRKVKTSFMIVNHNQAAPPVAQWSPYTAPIIIHSQPPQPSSSTVQNRLPH